jgi:hypothetical protein
VRRRLPEGAEAIGSSVAEWVSGATPRHPSKQQTLAGDPTPSPSPRHFLRKIFQTLGLGVDLTVGLFVKVLKTKEL